MKKLMELIKAGWVVTAALLLVVLTGCSPKSDAGSDGGNLADRKIKAVCTIGMVADIVRVVGGDRVEVEGLMGPGVDPHLYKASEGDVRKLGGADIIFYNGLNLEGKMADLFVRMSATRPTVPVTDGMDEKQLREPPEFAGHYDPHVWFGVTLWMSAVQRVEQALAKSTSTPSACSTARSRLCRSTRSRWAAWNSGRAACGCWGA
jgi:manganese/zinc/iron transport system substrate-binding protein